MPSSRSPERVRAVSQVEERLRRLGFSLPRPMAAIATYVPYTISAMGEARLIHVAGQGPFADGRLTHLGRLGEELDVEAGRACARQVVLNVIAQAAQAAREIYGEPALDRLSCLRLGCFVNCVDGYAEITPVLDAASELVTAAFGAAGRHARSDAGMPMLPMGTPVEIDGVFLAR